MRCIRKWPISHVSLHCMIKFSLNWPNTFFKWFGGLITFCWKHANELINIHNQSKSIEHMTASYSMTKPVWKVIAIGWSIWSTFSFWQTHEFGNLNGINRVTSAAVSVVVSVYEDGFHNYQTIDTNGLLSVHRVIWRPHYVLVISLRSKHNSSFSNLSPAGHLFFCGMWYRTFKKLDCSLIWNLHRM